jgi:hypothetical protein
VHVARTGKKRNACKVLVGKSERKRPLGRQKHVWEVNMRLELGEIGWGVID